MAEQQIFPGTIYERAPPGTRPPKPSLLRRALDWVPVQDFLAAHLGFSDRFNRLVFRLAEKGGQAVPAARAHFHFADALLLQINPSSVTMRLRDNFLADGSPRWVGTHFLDGGDWTPLLAPVAKSSSHAEIIELCRTRQNFRKGKRYGQYAQRISEGQTIWRNRIGLDTLDKLDGYFEYYLALIENIESRGILPHSDLRLRDQTGYRHRWTRTFWQDLAERDIGIAIAADGSLVRHTNGKHRMAAALALGLPQIPVEIRLVHARWLARQSEKLGLEPKEALLATIENARVDGWPAK
ncbi:MAG: hypothetical protein J7516_05520 [Shinella sp.]|nr:hypothetical protein [Shinella sp.]